MPGQVAAVRPPNVVHVVVAGDIGGAERLLLDLTTRPVLSGARHSIALMTPNPKLRALIMGAGVRVADRGPIHLHPLAYLWRAFGPRDVRWLENVLRTEQADLVHVHTYASHILGVRAAQRLGLPVLRTEHGVHHYTDPSCALGRRRALRRTDSIICVSNYVRDFVSAHAPEMAPRLRVIRNGVDEKRFGPRAFPADTPFTFSLVCRLEAWKQPDLAVRALAQLPDCRLIIAGDGSLRKKLEALAITLGVSHRIRFTGYTSDPGDAYAASHVSLNTSRDEPLGLSVLEAMASARPVIAFSGGGIPEIVRDGQTGWLVPEQRLEGLVAAMRQARAAPVHTLGLQARAFIEQECGIAAMCTAYAAAYAALSGSRAAGRG
ncbi:glycosyltransferase family 4 protein [Acetobacter sp. TBRC 12305]|uniref:Glycosyltransferase family 4 protein n=2 Tax=Acetobacter garciniae TaxID=2817435 RepID=A0A939KNK3_9PROT|nr:glycosyltransferase family 4 protein [Acetobacter garciniae]MBX0345695.1 glycosyltransferase family 4 protein [Acetobacter garciniae]